MTRGGNIATIGRRSAIVLTSALVFVSCGGDSDGARTTTPSTPSRTTTSCAPTTTTSTGTTTTSATVPRTTAPTQPRTTPPPVSTSALRVTRGDPARHRVAFSFDAGSDTGHAREILDLLARRGITASFGVCGNWARANPGVLRDLATAGHHLVNHTDEHRSFTGASTGTAPLTASERRAALDRADAAIASITGRSTKPWFRPPYGDTDASVDRDVGAAGYRYDVLWTVDSLGWKGVAPDAVVARCLERAENGAIYLFHVGSASTDIDALPAIIDGLVARGYTIGTVPSVL